MGNVGKILRRFGIRYVLFVLPRALEIVTLVGLISEFLSEDMMLLTGIWVVIMLVHETVRSALYNITFLSLLQPLPKLQKLRGLVILRNVEALAIGLSGLILVLLEAINSVTLLHFGLFLLFILVGWVVTIILLNQQYIRTLEAALKQRIIQGGILPVNDLGTLQSLTQKPESPTYPLLFASHTKSRYGIHLISLKSGLRFSRKALRPSLASSVM